MQGNRPIRVSQPAGYRGTEPDAPTKREPPKAGEWPPYVPEVPPKSWRRHALTEERESGGELFWFCPLGNEAESLDERCGVRACGAVLFAEGGAHEVQKRARSWCIG